MKNGKLQLMRFVFALCIILFHINVDFFDSHYQFTEHISFFARGKIGVEFFFVTSGFFLAMAASKNETKSDILGKSTIRYMLKKILRIGPYHVLAFAFTFLIICITERLSFLRALDLFAKSLPNLFLIQGLGIPSENIIGVEWYISCMLLASYILFPLCCRFCKSFTCIISPITGFLLVCYMTKVFGCLSRTGEWAGLCSKMLLRALAEMCFGIFAFEISRQINRMELSRKAKSILTIIESLLYIAALFYAVSTISVAYEAYILILLTCAVALTMSNQTLGNAFFCNRTIMFLGEYSLPLYLCQNFARKLVKSYFSDLPLITITCLILSITITLALIVLFLGRKLERNLQNTRVVFSVLAKP